jgi:hypothetical protein
MMTSEYRKNKNYKPKSVFPYSCRLGSYLNIYNTGGILNKVITGTKSVLE